MSKPTHALSFQQPWAWSILHAGKNIENRSWPTKRRGRIVIHTGLKYDHQGYWWLHETGLVVPLSDQHEDAPRGFYVGEVDIVDCVPLAECDSEWAFGPWCFRLENVEEYDEPIPAKGRLSFFPVGAGGYRKESDHDRS